MAAGEGGYVYTIEIDPKVSEGVYMHIGEALGSRYVLGNEIGVYDYICMHSGDW